MAYTIKTIYIPCDRQTVTDPGGAGADKPDTPVAIKSGTTAVTRGAIVGVRGTCATSAGTVTIKVYSDVSKTDELYNVDLAMTASPFKSSDMLAQGIPFFETPFFQVNNSVDPNNDIFITFYVQAIG